MSYVSSGQVSPHHHVPDSGWVSFYIRDEKDIPALLALFRRNYERIQPITHFPKILTPKK